MTSCDTFKRVYTERGFADLLSNTRFNMDVAYNQHASHVRRKNRSSTNLNSLSLAPLTTRLPLNDLDNTTVDDSPSLNSAPAVHYSTSYLQGKSAPTTPRLLSRSPGPNQSRSQPHSRGSSTPARLPISKSATHLPHQSSRGPKQKRGNGSNGGHKELATTDTDWVLRTGALMWTETRESKGQAWLLSRASSTSLAGSGSDDERSDDNIFEQLARERSYGSRHASRRGSLELIGAVDDERVYVSSPVASRFGSRAQSRAHSRAGSVRGGVLTPKDRRSMDGYFPNEENHHRGEEEFEEEEYAGPDFVNLDEKLETVEEITSGDDEAQVRRLVKNGGTGSGTWLGNVLGNWGLSSVEENEEEESEKEAEADETPTEGLGNRVGSSSDRSSSQQPRRRSSIRPFENIAVAEEERIPPPKENEGGWQDAAWLLTVASKVLL